MRADTYAGFGGMHDKRSLPPRGDRAGVRESTEHGSLRGRKPRVTFTRRREKGDLAKAVDERAEAGEGTEVLPQERAQEQASSVRAHRTKTVWTKKGQIQEG